MILGAALFAVYSRTGPNPVTPGDAGLSISYALVLSQLLAYMVRMASDFESNVVAIERIHEYVEVQQEASRRLHDIDDNLPANWPSAGAIRLCDVSMRYRPDLPLVLCGITCSIDAGEKVGVVGRTGSGKSSLSLALFRLVERASGSILVDGVDIASVGLYTLRSRITIVPQDPVLFSGTLRMNLDPSEEYDDAKLWDALERVQLASWLRGCDSQRGLDMVVAEEGCNMSAGQRQLVCLARALLRRTRVLVLDEATAAIDLDTDELLQRTIREQFAHCTVLTIAHRVNTIMDSSRVLVLEAGRVREFAPPGELLRDESSEFFKLCRNAKVSGNVG